MEAFSLLRYWKGGGGAILGGGKSGGDPLPGAIVATAVTPTTPSENEEVDADADNDDLFDLEFAVHDDDDDDEISNSKCEHDEALPECYDDENEGGNFDGRGEFHFNLSSGSSSSAVKEREETGDVYFKGRLVVPNDGSNESSQESSSASSSSTQLPVSSLLNKSATKFRVFLLGFKKTKGDSTQVQQTAKNGNSGSNSNKLFTIKFKVEEVPIVSLFTRDSSKSQAQGGKKPEAEQATTTVSDEHKRFSKEVVQKYFKKVKPLYVKVSKKHSEKPRSSTGQEKETGDSANSVKAMKVVYKHLGMNKSSSSTAAAASASNDAASISLPSTVTDGVISKRRDDSLLQQQDGIQGAILHCKRSFNGSRDSESSPLPTPGSDHCPEYPLNLHQCRLPIVK